MEPQSPRSLQDLCIDLLAKRTDILWTWRKRPLFGEPKRAEWKDPAVFLNSDIADKLLERLNYEQNLYDSTLSTLTSDHVHLQDVKIRLCDTVKGWGLEVLKHHELRSLVIITNPGDWEGNTVCSVLKCIGNKSFESLQHLSFYQICRRYPKCTFSGRIWPDDDDFLQQSVVETLSRFNCLRSLDVRETNLTDTNLAILGKSLPHVENLDLSWNSKITDISPLKNCQKTLKSLSLGMLYDMAAESTLATLVTLSGLTFLDVSTTAKPVLGNKFTADILLQTPDILPNLVCLDLSYRTVESEDAFRHFLDAHQSLQSLMLSGSRASRFKSLQDYKPRLTVGGEATLEQYTAALRYYNRRSRHRPLTLHEDRRKLFVTSLYFKLEKRYPPCPDDQLVQEVLDSFPTRSSFFSEDHVWFCICWGVLTIGRLLRRGDVTCLQPETKRHLALLCHRTLERSKETPVFKDAPKAAGQILQCLGGPEPPPW